MNFDQFAQQYDEDLQRGLSLSGEDKNFFACRRLLLVKEYFETIHFTPKLIIDFGCGTGTNTVIINQIWPQSSIIGLDNSLGSLQVARSRINAENVTFLDPTDFHLRGIQGVDWVFCNGVFHHINEQDRLGVLQHIFSQLRPGGFFTFFENNPYNPGTRWVMHRIPFDRDAKLLDPYSFVKVLKSAGFQLMKRRFLFIFPRFLSIFRKSEKWFSRMPFGAQYGLFLWRPNHETFEISGRERDLK